MSDKLKITAIDSGPLKVSNLKSLEFCGKAMEVDGDAFFCRCGESNNAPFCNGTHSKVGFTGAHEGG